jgi:hypothetical protein
MSRILLLLALATHLGCKSRETRPPSATARVKDSRPTGPRHWTVPSAARALQIVLERSRPTVIGFGELHHKTDSAPVQTAIGRFTREMLDPLAGRATDLVVETWVARGDCGAHEKRAVRKVEQVTKRPETTENELVGLLKRAKGVGIQPHILSVSCDAYKKLTASGALDLEELLGLITRKLGSKTVAVLSHRRKSSAADAGRTRRPPLVLVYGGALHNDLFPADDLAAFSYAPRVGEASGGKYVEVDLYVPELVDRDKNLKGEPWYPIFRRQATKDRVLLIERGAGSYIVVFRRGVRGGQGQ